jgi:hypothetical protein
MEYETQTKDIADGSISLFHIFDVDYLRGYKTWGTTSHEQILLSSHKLGQSKISDHALKAVFLADENVLGLEVSVHDPLAMHLSCATEQTEQDLTGLVMSEDIFFLSSWVITLILSSS